MTSLLLQRAINLVRVLVLAVTSHVLYGTTCITVHVLLSNFNVDFQLHASGKAGEGGWEGGT